MSNSRAINKSYHASMETGGKREIEMPPLNEITQDIAQQSRQPESRLSESRLPESPFPVPESLPDDVEQALSSSQSVEDVEQEEENISDRNESEEDGSIEESVEAIPSNSKSAPKESFKLIREAKEKAERERDSYMRHALELEMKYKQQEEQQRKQAIIPEEPEIDFNLDEDALVDGKHLKAVTSKIKRLEAQLEQRNVEDKIRTQYPDFEKVVSAENVSKLNEQYPEIAQMLRDTGDIMAKASAAYSVIKKFGIHKDVYEADKAKAIANAAKPRPLASVKPQQGDSPLSKANAFANGLTPELQEQLRREMYESRQK